MILRCYGAARPVHRNDADWGELDAHFEPHFAARQIFDFSIDLVQKSCGYAVPEMDFVKGRDTLENWAANKGEQGVREYWAERNGETLDGTPTLIAEKNL